jgi:hypothetical protein
MDSSVNFSPYTGDLMGLPVDENHLVFRWNGPGKILFSCAKQGDAITIHLASNKNGLRYLKKAVDDFVQFVFWLFDWCTMVIGKIATPSVERIAQKTGFVLLGRCDKGAIYMRLRQ